uniref:NADH-ubiquinone oxidoreductase chain 5 n=1 Tax=Hemisus marmoratus TaxID=83971 RepID=S4V1N9_9NEOB|nr:NADH dehydrogenase subunit 5 [Hemisus marmoratus]
MTACLALTILSLTSPFLFLSSKNLATKITKAVLMATIISFPPIPMFINQNIESISIHWHWTPVGSSTIDLSILFNCYSVIFTPIALFVTWNIMEFSLWYMKSDPKINTFFKYLLIFLLSMILLVYSGNLFVLFIGWEGVGIMSFMLIGWYHARNNSGAAALQAVLYNRVGDIGFLFSICWLLTNSNSLDLETISSMNLPYPILISLIVAAASKSAQFGFHPWLASAMEGPTPVSALLHSSTMVVAGIFLLIRTSQMLAQNQTALTSCLCLGAISTFFAATCALTQNDIKKIIAYSTASQLGLMMVAIGLNFPHLAFFHICTHAFFKAMLFLCSGSIIHNLNDEQDIRKMGGLQNLLPITMTCTSVGSLALMGTPFLAGFFSKDSIIEVMNTSLANTLAIMLTIIATSFTAIYSLRLIFFASMKYPRTAPIVSINENNLLIINPLKRLAIGSIISGLFIINFMIPPSPIIMTMPLYSKMAAVIITILAFLVATDLANLAWSSSPPSMHSNSKTLDTAFFTSLLHRLTPMMLFDLAQKTTHITNLIWLEKLGPKGLSNSQLPPIKTSQKTQTGLIKTYLSTFSVTVLLSMIISQLV